MFSTCSLVSVVYPLKVALSQKILEKIYIANVNSKSVSCAENFYKLFTVLGGKFKFSAQDSDL
jgi:hypothetical protein